MSKHSKKVFNHVIILGAGASFTSGYPIGEGLRLLIASQNHVIEKLKKHFPEEEIFVYFRDVSHFNNAIELFRRGGFGTVDEFSKLASGSSPEMVQDMKRYMRFILALHNPEESFEKSDYYPFIQRLFADNLYQLKPNLTVISFNCDCYFDYLLLSAFHQRQLLRENGYQERMWDRQALNSGFWAPSNKFDWLENTTAFNYFKLHGSIAYGDEGLGHRMLFHSDRRERLSRFSAGVSGAPVPPIVFPWELFDGRGNVISDAEFVFVKTAKDSEERTRGRLLQRHFLTMWEAAQEKIQRAEKISFVGLSMHEFLEPGFQYLFGNKAGLVQMVVANPANESYRDSDSKLHPLSPCGKVASLLHRVAPNLEWTNSTAENDNAFNPTDLDENDMTVRYSFREFIEKEME